MGPGVSVRSIMFLMKTGHWQVSCFNLVLGLSLVRRKPVFGACDQARLNRPAQPQKLDRYLKTLDIETRGIILSRQRTTKALIRLRGCAG